MIVVGGWLVECDLLGKLGSIAARIRGFSSSLSARSAEGLGV